MEIRQLQYLIALSEEQGFAPAAQRLGISQAPIKYALKKLEDEVGADLVLFKGKKIAFTPAGQKLLADAHEIVALAGDAAAAAQRAATQQERRLSFGYISILELNLVPDLLAAFRRHDADFLLEPHNLLALEQYQALRHGRIDAGLIRLPVEEPAGPLYSVQPLFREDFCVALPEDHPLAESPAIHPRALRDIPFAWWKKSNTPALHDHVFAFFRDVGGFEPRIETEGIARDSLLAYVQAGLGFSVVPRTLARVGRAGVRFVEFEAPGLWFPIALLSLANAAPHALPLFLERVREVGARHFAPLTGGA